MFRICLGGFLLGDHQGKFAHFSPEFGDDPFGRGGADSRQRGQPFGILIGNQWATSLTGRTIARSALRTPTPSTEQNISKNSRSISVENPISRGVSLPWAGLPSR